MSKKCPKIVPKKQCFFGSEIFHQYSCFGLPLRANPRDIERATPYIARLCAAISLGRRHPCPSAPASTQQQTPETTIFPEKNEGQSHPQSPKRKHGGHRSTRRVEFQHLLVLTLQALDRCIVSSTLAEYAAEECLWPSDSLPLTLSLFVSLSLSLSVSVCLSLSLSRALSRCAAVLQFLGCLNLFDSVSARKKSL